MQNTRLVLANIKIINNYEKFKKLFPFGIDVYNFKFVYL